METHDNLTRTQNVIKDHTGLEPLAGYVLVIYEKLGDVGAEFWGLLRPGDRFAKPKRFLGLGRTPEYFAIAVNEAPDLRYSSADHDIALDDQIHKFSLTFDLAYRVSNPEAIATARDDDPLRQLLNEITRLIRRQIARSGWEDIRHKFREVEKSVLAHTLDDLRKYASNLGLQIHSIDMGCRLPKEGVEVDIEREKADQEAKKAAIEEEKTRRKLQEGYKTEDLQRKRSQQLAEEDEDSQQMLIQKQQINQIARLKDEDILHKTEMNREIREAQAKGISSAFIKVGENISTPQELQDAANVVQHISSIGPDGSVSADRSTFPTALSSAPSGGYLTAGDSGLTHLLNQVLVEVQKLSCPFERKQALLSVILHLFAELLLDDKAEEETVKLYAGKIEKLCVELRSQLSATQFKFFEQFVQYEQLRYRIN